MNVIQEINKSDKSESVNVSQQFLIAVIELELRLISTAKKFRASRIGKEIASERGDVPGWVLVVLMTTGLVTAIWTIAAPRLSAILKNSLDSMNGIR